MRFRIAVFALALLSLPATIHASYRISVWQPRNLTASGRIGQHAGIITESNPTFYRMNTNVGTLYESSTATNPTYVNNLAGTEIIPTFQNTDDTGWRGDLVVSYVIHPNTREQSTNEIVNAVVTRGWAGADIDYENVPSSAKADFNAFIALLAGKLHANNKKLSICVYAKTSDVASWDPPNGQDWSVLDDYADWIKIMAYGPHSTPKANSTTAYIGQVLTYAKSRITDHKKIMIGIPWYAQEYTQSGSSWSYKSYGYDQALANNPGVTPARDSLSGEMHYEYTDSSNLQHSIWYTDATTYGTKVQYVLANHPTIGGFAHWCAGEEDTKVYGVVQQLKPRWEFNKDNNHDLVLRNSTSGEIALWNMSVGTPILQTSLGTDTFDVVAAGHFTRDGQTDLILRKHSTGEMKLWQMNIHTVASISTLWTTTDLNWKVVGAADVDSDGRHEIIWHNQSTGTVAWWKRDPSTGNWSSSTIGTAAVGTWVFSGVADFNIDGTDDLVWYNASTGATSIWTMKNGATTSTANVNTNASAGYRIVGVGDFNHDFYPDILWRHDTSSANVIWYMKDRVYQGGGATTSATPDWAVVRVGDFNGDDVTDILWRNTTGGDLVIWLMNGLAASSVYVTNPGPNWNVTAK